MRFKSMVTALFICAVFAAVSTGSARAGWTIEGVELAKGSTETVSISGGPLTITASFLGTSIEIEAASVECAVGSTCTIDNGTAASPTPGHSAGRLTFTGVKVLKPANCTVHTPGVADGTVNSNALADKIIMDPKGGSAVFDAFFPAVGTNWFELEFTGSKCPFTELVFPWEGTLTAESVHEGATKDIQNKTGELFVDQSLLFSQTTQETGCGQLFLAGNKSKPVYIDGTLHTKLSGGNAGQKFGEEGTEFVPQSGWTVGCPRLKESETASITGTQFTLTASVLGAALELEAGSIECAGTCTIENGTEKAPAPGHSAGKLRFTTVKVKSPANCTVHTPGDAAGTVTTTSLTDEVIMDPTAGSTAVFDKFFPESGTKWFELEFAGEACAFRELKVPLEGTLAAEAVHGSDTPSKTGELFVDQSLLLSQATQETGGGLLYVAEAKAKPAFLDGTAHEKLSGAATGVSFGADG